MSDPIRAAGGVPARRVGAELEVVLVHRRRYGDWTFPKGKVEPDETDEACAVREVEEETGLACALGPELSSTTYASRGRPKRVRYWLLTVAAGTVSPREGEIDDVRWVSVDEAAALLTYDHDRVVLRDAITAA